VRAAVAGAAKAAVALVAMAAALAGCASLTSAPPTKLAIAQRTHEYPSPPPPAQTVDRGDAAGAEAAVRAFASTYINWTASTVSAHMRTLADASVGQARSAMQLAAAQTAGDYELQRGGIANSGTVEVVAPLRAQRDRYVVVTRELTTATNTTAYQGLAPAWHVAVATVQRLAGGAWAVSGWQPES
jgi:hypothetical protein